MIHFDAARRQQITYLHRLFPDNGYPLTFIKRAMEQRPLPTTPNCRKWDPQTKGLPQHYIEGVSELIARHCRPYNLAIAHEPTESLRRSQVHVEDRIPTLGRRDVVYNIPRPECLTNRQFSTRMKEHQSAVRWQDKNLPLTLHCHTTGHMFDWPRALVTVNG